MGFQIVETYTCDICKRCKKLVNNSEYKEFFGYCENCYYIVVWR